MGDDSPGWVVGGGNDLADTLHPGPGQVDDRDRGPRAMAAVSVSAGSLDLDQEPGHRGITELAGIQPFDPGQVQGIGEHVEDQGLERAGGFARAQAAGCSGLPGGCGYLGHTRFSWLG